MIICNARCNNNNCFINFDYIDFAAIVDPYQVMDLSCTCDDYEVGFLLEDVELDFNE